MLAKSYRQILVEARALIEDEKNWTRDRGACDAMGFTCDPRDAEACAWCAVGALFKITGSTHGRSINGPLSYLVHAASEAGYTSVNYANDQGTHGLVLGIFDAAIKLAAKEREII